MPCSIYKVDSISWFEAYVGSRTTVRLQNSYAAGFSEPGRRCLAAHKTHRLPTLVCSLAALT
eukprot:scaffold196650_cov19-Prasinocladus_malaysianus.AAC.1